MLDFMARNCHFLELSIIQKKIIKLLAFMILLDLHVMNICSKIEVLFLAKHVNY